MILTKKELIAFANNAQPQKDYFHDGEENAVICLLEAFGWTIEELPNGKYELK